MTDNPLWDLIQAYMDDPKHRYSPTPADLARETGVSEQVLSKWKLRATLPSALSLMEFARGTGIPFGDLLTAALEGKGYLPAGSAVTIAEGYDEWLKSMLEGRHVAPVAARRSSTRPPKRRKD